MTGYVQRTIWCNPERLYGYAVVDDGYEHVANKSGEVARVDCAAFVTLDTVPDVIWEQIDLVAAGLRNEF